MRGLKSSVEYECGLRPQPGVIVEVLPGISWLRLPLPFVLTHINCWLLEDRESRMIVDTGFFVDGIRAIWEDIFSGMPDSPLPPRVLVTHLHPDHAGCAGWLCERLGAELYMPREEYLLCRLLVADTGQPAPQEGRRFYHAAGFSESQLALYVDGFGSFGRVVSELPQSYHRLHDGLELDIGANCWQVIIGRGHSPEHACLYCEEMNVLISGDQVLPTISSNVGVWPTEPAADPLADWLESLRHLKKILPDDVLVLPSHGRPFRGGQNRLDELIKEHEDCLGQLLGRCRQPRRAIDVFPALFRGEVSDSNLLMAVGEAIAHLNYLCYRGQLRAEIDGQGTRWYQAIQSA